MNAQNRESIIEVCRILAEQENLTVTVKESAKGALFAGIGVFVGGLLAGPLGMAVGGTLTSVAVAVSAQRNFKSVVQIINEMNYNQKQRLAEAVQTAIQSIKPEDYVRLLTLVMSSSSVKERVLIELGNFLRHEFQAQLVRSN